MKQLLLVGGGHAHLAVLRALAAQPPAGVEITLVTPYAHQTYSGMLPGWLVGHYPLPECQIDLRPLADAAGARLLLREVVGLDAAAHYAVLSDQTRLPYDWVSIDMGSESRISGLESCGERLVPIRPLDSFLQQWPATLAAASRGDTPATAYSLALLGAGAAGVELAFAAQHAFQQRGLPTQVHLISPELLAGHAPAVVERVRARLAYAGVRFHPTRATCTPTGVLLGSGRHLAVDQIWASTGAQAAAWLATTGLLLDEAGYIRVNVQHQSESHANVFAAGDVSARSDPNFERSGVHAVHAGSALAHNILAVVNNQPPLQEYRPKARSLYLLATGPKHAIASWGRWSAAGTWVWYWKKYLDTGFVGRYS